MELLLVIVTISLSSAIYDLINKKIEKNKEKQEDRAVVKTETSCTMEPLNLENFEFDDGF